LNPTRESLGALYSLLRASRGTQEEGSLSRSKRLYRARAREVTYGMRRRRHDGVIRSRRRRSRETTRSASCRSTLPPHCSLGPAPALSAGSRGLRAAPLSPHRSVCRLWRLWLCPSPWRRVSWLCGWLSSNDLSPVYRFRWVWAVRPSWGCPRCRCRRLGAPAPPS
jgi:hypothetical protein